MLGVCNGCSANVFHLPCFAIVGKYRPGSEENVPKGKTKVQERNLEDRTGDHSMLVSCSSPISMQGPTGMGMMLHRMQVV